MPTICSLKTQHSHHPIVQFSRQLIPQMTLSRFYHTSSICYNNNSNSNATPNDNNNTTNIHGFTHVSGNQSPTMINIMDKKVTKRSACAQAIVQFPPHVLDALQATAMPSSNLQTSPPTSTSTLPLPPHTQEHRRVVEIASAKGPVFSTAIVAGTMAVKKTSDLIPFCHPLPVESCKINIHIVNHTDVVVNCDVQVTHKTGVEMEALVGASVAALTVYDMCKALSHEIIIKETKLIKKTGGKSDFNYIDQK